MSSRVVFNFCETNTCVLVKLFFESVKRKPLVLFLALLQAAPFTVEDANSILNSHMVLLHCSSTIWWPWRSSTRFFSVPDQRTFSSSHSTTWMPSETLSKTLPASLTRLMRRINSSSRCGPKVESWVSDRFVHTSLMSECPLMHTRGEMANM